MNRERSWSNSGFYCRPALGVGGLGALLALVAADPAGGMDVPLVKSGGVYEVPIRINGVLTLNFIIDSGAAAVQIPADVASTLLRTGTIAKEDFLPGSQYQLADGTIVTSPRFILRHLEVSGYRVDNVEAMVGAAEGSLLLGQTMLERFPQWSLDNRRHVLVIGEEASGSAPPSAIPPTPPPVANAPVDDTIQAEATGSQGSPTVDDTRASTWTSDWGNGIRAIAQRTPCPVKEFEAQGYRYALGVDIPAGRLRTPQDAWSVDHGRALTVVGCWFAREDGLVHAKLRRKKDGKTWEQDLNFADGSWVADREPARAEPKQATVTGRSVYYAAQTAPSEGRIPPEAPLCYRFEVPSLEEQMVKLKRKYGDAVYGVRIVSEQGSRILMAERKGDAQETIVYRYFEDPSACMEYQKTHRPSP